MTEELTYETIPNEYWPKCDWCGNDIGEGEEFDTEYDKLTICNTCFYAIMIILNTELPSLLSEILSEIDLRAGRKQLFGSYKGIDGSKVAIQNMKEAQDA